VRRGDLRERAMQSMKLSESESAERDSSGPDRHVDSKYRRRRESPMFFYPGCRLYLESSRRLLLPISRSARKRA
jgi:hypothetical protein